VGAGIACVAEPLLVRRASWDGLSANIPRFWREADRVYREYQHVFKDAFRARDTLIGLHSDFVLRALYKRNFSLAWTMGRRAVRHDVPLLRVVPRVLINLVRNRMRRHRPAQRLVSQGAGLISAICVASSRSDLDA
jgi:hypothetical protein